MKSRSKRGEKAMGGSITGERKGGNTNEFSFARNLKECSRPFKELTKKIVKVDMASTRRSVLCKHESAVLAFARGARARRRSEDPSKK